MSSQGGLIPKSVPVGWVFLDRHRHNGITIRWRRDESQAYVLEGHRLGDHAVAGILVRQPQSVMSPGVS